MKCVTVSRALIVRLFFASHGLISIYLLCLYTNRSAHWYLATALAGLFFESMVTLIRNHGHEWKWFCPSVFFYLFSVVPAIWCFEMELFYVRELANKKCQDKRTAQNQTIINGTAKGTKMIDCEYYKSMDLKNNPFLLKEGYLVNFDEMERSARMSEQLLLLLLILGRWFLPKGKLSHDQLSQLLLVYLGTAADIAEFFEAFKEKAVKSNQILCLFILAIWSWSLLQFAFVLTAARARKDQSGILSGRNQSKTSYSQYKVPFVSVMNSKSERDRSCISRFWRTFSADVYGIIISITLQDGPFLAFRLTLIFKFEVVSYTNMFFTAKNSLVILLLIYRLVVIWCEKSKQIMKQEDDSGNSKVVLRRLDNVYQDGLCGFQYKEPTSLYFEPLDCNSVNTLPNPKIYKCSDPRNVLNRCSSYIDLETGTLVRNDKNKISKPNSSEPISSYDYSNSKPSHKHSSVSSKKVYLSPDIEFSRVRPQSLTSIQEPVNEPNCIMEKNLSNSSKIDADIESICNEARKFMEKLNPIIISSNHISGRTN